MAVQGVYGNCDLVIQDGSGNLLERNMVMTLAWWFSWHHRRPHRPRHWFCDHNRPVRKPHTIRLKRAQYASKEDSRCWAVLWSRTVNLIDHNTLAAAKLVQIRPSQHYGYGWSPSRSQRSNNLGPCQGKRGKYANLAITRRTDKWDVTDA